MAKPIDWFAPFVDEDGHLWAFQKDLQGKTRIHMVDGVILLRGRLDTVVETNRKMGRPQPGIGFFGISTYWIK